MKRKVPRSSLEYSENGISKSVPKNPCVLFAVPADPHNFTITINNIASTHHHHQLTAQVYRFIYVHSSLFFVLFGFGCDVYYGCIPPISI